ncbi:MAG: D-alanine--D-alanine ligase, partial [Angelakisella sp.]
MSKQTVAVLFGGVSSEHEVSRLSVTSVLRNLDSERYTAIMVGITRDGRWLCYDGDIAKIADGAWEKESGKLTPCVLSPDRATHGLLLLHAHGGFETLHADVVFPVLHGKNGEDGTVQGLLELAGIPYVGCDVIASANCMDKDVAKRLFSASDIPNARFISVRLSDMADFAAVEAR